MVRINNAGTRQDMVDRCRYARDMAEAHGQDGVEAFEVAYERFQRQNRFSDYTLRSWSEAVLAGQTVTIFRDDEGEHWTTVDFFDQFDDEMAEEVYNQNQVYSCYDCTGQEFMCGIHYFKAFGGYVVVADWALDV